MEQTICPMSASVLWLMRHCLLSDATVKPLSDEVAAQVAGHRQDEENGEDVKGMVVDGVEKTNIFVHPFFSIPASSSPEMKVFKVIIWIYEES